MITVVIPAYKEADRIPKTLSEIQAFIRRNPEVITKVIVVDDGSAEKGADKTVERVLRYSTRIPLQVECLAKNQGKWAAVMKGIELAQTDAVLIMDADGSAPIWDINKLEIAHVLRTRTSVFGTRFAGESVVEGKSSLRKLVSYGYRAYVKLAYFFATSRGCPIDDMQAPFKLIFKSRLRGNFLCAPRFAGDLNFALMYSGPINNLPLHFIHVRGDNIKTSTVFDMFFETIRVVRLLRKWRVQNDAEDILYVAKQQYF